MNDPRPPSSRRAFPLVLGGFVLLAFAFSLVIPLGEAPDEVSHFGYVEWLAAKKLPPPSEGPAVGEAHQPPLYYLIGAVSTFWIAGGSLPVIANPDFQLGDSQTPNLLLHTRREAFPFHDVWLAWHLVRLLSVLMGAVTIWAVWRIALLLFEGNERLALGTTAFVAFLPTFTFLSGMVNNDNLVLMLSTLSLLFMLEISRRPFAMRSAIFLGILLGLALLTKLNAGVVWVFVIIMYAYLGWQRRSWTEAALNLAVCIATALIVAGPWSIYNLALVGDPFGWAIYLKVGTLRQTPITFPDWINILLGVYTSFWGRFGGALQIHLPQALYAALGLVALLALAGWIKYGGDAWRTGHSKREGPILFTFASFWLVLGAAYVSWARNDAGAGQVRQLLPGLPLLAVFVVAGLARLAPTYEAWLVRALSLGGFAFSLGILFYLNTLYAASASPPAAPSSESPVIFGETISLLDHEIEPGRKVPGDSVGVHLVWESVRATDELYWIQFQLENPNELVAHQDSVPFNGRKTTDWWQPGEVFDSRARFTIPQEIAPGSYDLLLGLHPFGESKWLSQQGADTFLLGTIEVSPPPP